MGFIQRLKSFSQTFGLTSQERLDIWRSFGSFRANQFGLGTNQLIQNSYESNVDCYSVINRIIDTGKVLPFIIETQNRDGSWDVVMDSELHSLMANPNTVKGYSWQDIIEQKLLYLLVTGNDYTVGIVPEGFRTIAELDVLPSNYVTVQTSGNFFLPDTKYTFELDRTKAMFDGSQLLHTRYFNPGVQSVQETQIGMSPIQAASKVVQVGNDRWSADANLLQNRGAIGLVTDKSERPMTATEAEQVQNAFQRDTAGTRNFGKVKVTNKNLSYVQLAMSSVDLQLIEKGVINLRALCNVYGLDSSLFNDPANKTFNNRKEAEKALYTNAVLPNLDKIVKGFNQWLVPSFFPNQRARMRVDVSNIQALQEDFHEKAKTFSLLKTSGIITANQAARELNQPESDDENADKLIVSNSLIPLEDISQQEPSNPNQE